MKSQEFKQQYLRTLQSDPESGLHYLKLPIAHLEELGYLQDSLIRCIQVLNQAEELPKETTQNSVYWLCRVLLAAHPQEELAGLQHWLDN